MLELVTEDIELQDFIEYSLNIQIILILFFLHPILLCFFIFVGRDLFAPDYTETHYTKTGTAQTISLNKTVSIKCNLMRQIHLNTTLVPALIGFTQNKSWLHPEKNDLEAQKIGKKIIRRAVSNILWFKAGEVNKETFIGLLLFSRWVHC